MSKPSKYQVQDFSKLKDLNGIPNNQIELHLGLYEGYVKNVNLLNQKIFDLAQDNKMDQPEYAELKRRLGFEYGGMILHKYYFENLSSDSKADHYFNGVLSNAWGSYEKWEKEFTTMGTIRGVGWVVLYFDPESGNLHNHWITLHDENVIPTFSPLLVMDVWEHAFMAYRKPSEKDKYVKDFMSNINWKKVLERYDSFFLAD